MANKKRYLITIAEFNEDKLGKDLPFSAVPDAVGQAIDQLTQQGALDVQMVFLLDETQKERIELVLQHNSLLYPELITASERSGPPSNAAVLYLHDRRQRPKNPGDDPRAS